MSGFFTEPDAPSFDDPLGMLRACHARIERQLATLRRLAVHLPVHGADRDAQLAARAILRYFDTAAPNHHADEEASVFPRLLVRAPAARAIVATLERDHHVAFHTNWRRLRPLLCGIASGQRDTLPPALVNRVCEAYAAHIALENATLIPMCAEALTLEDLVDIGGEMAARRGTAWQRTRPGPPAHDS